MTHGLLFSGIGGFELGARLEGIETLWNCEIESFPRSILKKRFPSTQQYEDINDMQNPSYVDIISGGFPCQDISLAGKGIGIKGGRSGLWGEMFRVIRDVRPQYVLAENSPALSFRGFERILCDLSEIGYNAEWQCLYGYQFGSRDKRGRMYVIAYSDQNPMGSMGSIFQSISRFQDAKEWGQIWNSFELDTKAMVFEKYGWGYSRQELTAEPLLCGKSDAIPYQLDRLEALGNAVKPIIARYLFWCIKEYDKRKTTLQL